VLDSNLGKRLRQRREEIGISLRELARRTELTASFLSQVELGKTSVSLDSLRRIAEVLQVPLFSFLSEKSPGEEVSPGAQNQQNGSHNNDEVRQYSPVVRVGYRPKLLLPTSGLVYEMVVPDMGRKMEAMVGHLSPGTGNVARRLREPTEEFIYVLSGALLVGLEQGEYILQVGDTIYFEGETLNKLACASEDTEVVWMSVITPAIF